MGYHQHRNARHFRCAHCDGLGLVPVTFMLTVLGAAGLAIALGLRGILSNVSSGLMILALRPMPVGGYIEGAGFVGSVVEIELFNTVLKNSNGLYAFVPNSKIWGVILTNYTREPKRRVSIKVGISYDADIAVARRTMLDLLVNDTRILSQPEPVVHVTDMNRHAVMVRLRFWTAITDYWDTRHDLIESVKLGYQVINQSYPSTKAPIEEPVTQVGVAVEKCTKSKVHFVTHSMGGILTRAWLLHNYTEKIGRVLCLGRQIKARRLLTILPVGASLK